MAEIGLGNYNLQAKSSPSPVFWVKFDWNTATTIYLCVFFFWLFSSYNIRDKQMQQTVWSTKPKNSYYLAL